MKHYHFYLSSAFNLSILILLLVSPTTQAVNMPPVDTTKMQNIMLKMNQMQNCLSAIDPEKFNQAEQAMIQAHVKITRFCQQKKRDLAQQEAIRFTQFLQQSETLNEIERCNQPMRGVRPSMPLMEQTSAILAKQNICDIMSPP
ncbi:hypothetical protein [Thiomicrorhabdus arctica]|uniref:hypothetical protein n=1 Tax=Thiomicrorhabdus arctica TaxID=131540 RepID=UPI0003757B98|nr:hypothetical protein [Thiomicrorhabdus arctica]